MHVINEHEFLSDEQGNLTLLLDVLGFDEPADPVLLVAQDDNKAYLRRSPQHIHEIVGINADIIVKVRAAESIVVLELLGENINHSYEVACAILEDDDEAANG